MAQGLSIFAGLIGAAGAVFGLRGALIVVRDSMEDILRQSRCATLAAFSGCVASVANAVQPWL
jgi:membrane associated rhomboid family serine protease